MVWVLTPMENRPLIMNVDEDVAASFAAIHPRYIYFFAELVPVEVP